MLDKYDHSSDYCCNNKTGYVDTDTLYRFSLQASKLYNTTGIREMNKSTSKHLYSIPTKSIQRVLIYCPPQGKAQGEMC